MTQALPMIPVPLRLPPELLDVLRAMSEEDDVPMQRHIRRAVQEYVERKMAKRPRAQVPPRGTPRPDHTPSGHTMTDNPVGRLPDDDPAGDATGDLGVAGINTISPLGQMPTPENSPTGRPRSKRISFR